MRYRAVWDVWATLLQTVALLAVACGLILLVLSLTGCASLRGARPAVSLEADRAALAMAVDRVEVVRAGAAEAALVETGVVLDGALIALGALQAGTVGTPAPGAVEAVGSTTRAQVAQALAGVATDQQHIAALVAQGRSLEEAQGVVATHNRLLVRERDRLRAQLDAATAESAQVHGKLKQVQEIATTATQAAADRWGLSTVLAIVGPLVLAVGAWGVKNKVLVGKVTSAAVGWTQEAKHAHEAGAANGEAVPINFRGLVQDHTTDPAVRAAVALAYTTTTGKPAEVTPEGRGAMAPLQDTLRLLLELVPKRS